MAEGRGVDGGAHPMLLATKFLPPLTRDGYVRRERLHDLLSGASNSQVTLVSAPAGSGKTALVAAWLADFQPDRRAWLSLDARDNDLVRIWAYLIAALRGLAEGVGDGALNELIRNSGRGPLDGWLGLLVNDLVAVERPTSYLVIDDLHLITDPDIRASVNLFVANMPQWLRLIIVTRADPALPLPRMRADGRLTEIRQIDLRFEHAEANRLFRAEGINDLTDDQLQWMMARTEGWAAGLQLAAIVLGEHPATDRLSQIAGSNRTFADYLVSEVVDTTTDEIRNFLFTTSVLDRVSPSLAQAVSGCDDAGRMLRDAQQRGLFIVALDEHGEWFRYHTLFAEAIQSEARSREPELVRAANENAARWFEQHDDVVIALEHWFAAGRPDEALRIALAASYLLIDTGQLKSIERIASLIPASAVGADPYRQLDYAMIHNPIDADVCLSWVDEAGRAISALAAPDARLMVRYQTMRAICNLILGDWDAAVVHASASIDPLGIGEGDSPIAQRTGLQLLRAKAWTEQPDDAEQIFRAYIDNPRTARAVRSFIAPCTWALAAAIGGRVRDATMWSSRASAAAQQVAVSPAAYQELLLARAIVDRELGDNDSARAVIDEVRSAAMATYHSLRTVAEVELALGYISDNRPVDAARVLENVSLALPSTPLGPRIYDAIDRAWSELHLQSGNIVDARHAAERMRIGFWRDATVAKVLLAEGATERAASLVDSLEPSSPRQQVTRWLLRARALQRDDHESSASDVRNALMTASTLGMGQTVVALSQGLGDLLESESWVAPDEWMQNIRRTLAIAPRRASPRAAQLYEQPTERERTAIRLLASRLTMPEIAREMAISPNTLKTHIKSLYRKLDVSSREDAVAVARRNEMLG